MAVGLSVAAALALILARLLLLVGLGNLARPAMRRPGSALVAGGGAAVLCRRVILDRVTFL
jgi:hypothetical protein